jgi:hypothetical protein
VATAGRPASVIPWSSRRPRSTSQLGAIAQATATTPDATSERWISRVLPTTSDTGPTTSSVAPRPIVVRDTDRVLCAAETPNARENSGSSAWVQ